MLALEWARHGITVNAISPTVTLTEQACVGRPVGEEMKALIPVGRFASPAVALFLASQAAYMITGENVLIDGGYTIS